MILFCLMKVFFLCLFLDSKYLVKKIVANNNLKNKTCFLIDIFEMNPVEKKLLRLTIYDIENSLL